MRIVLVSPFPADRNALERLLSDDGHQVASAATRSDGVELARRERADVVLADVQVIGHDGHALLRELSDSEFHPRVIFLCPRASGTFENDGIVCLTKPVDLAQLQRHLSVRRAA
ncbi:MAG TPA: response regulator [Kofleriaceae bacterium]|nr:response regulator [Kofleriaceae bacterium]